MPPGEVAVKAARQQQRQPPAVGDGGSSWRLKALQRAQAAAAEQGRHVSEVRAAGRAELTVRRPAAPLIWQSLRSCQPTDQSRCIILPDRHHGVATIAGVGFALKADMEVRPLQLACGWRLRHVEAFSTRDGRRSWLSATSRSRT